MSNVNESMSDLTRISLSEFKKELSSLVDLIKFDYLESIESKAKN